MKTLRKHSIEIILVSEYCAEKVFVTPEWFKSATATDSEKLIAKIKGQVQRMEKLDAELKKAFKKKGQAPPSDQQLLAFING